jgi:Na+/proline symporter
LKLSISDFLTSGHAIKYLNGSTTNDTNPLLIRHFGAQRTYAAIDLMSLKSAYVTLTGDMWFMMMIGVFIATIRVQILKDNEVEGKEVTSPFILVVEEVMDLGGYARVIRLVAITAALASIMSTTNSLLIVISYIVTEEIVYP